MATPTKPKMHIYSWEGINKRGDLITGEMLAINQFLVQAKLETQGISVRRIHKKAASWFSNNAGRIRHADIVHFSRHLATMLNSGIPLLQALDIIGRGHAKQKMVDLILVIKQDVASGITLAQALKRHDSYFDALFCNLVNAGEQSGALTMMLNHIAAYMEKVLHLRSKVKRALLYPLVVMIVAGIVAAILLIFVVPQFATMFASYGAALPAFTQIVIDLSQILRNYWWLSLGLLASFWGGFILAKRRSLAFNHMLDRLLLKAPILGPITQKVIIARLFRTLATTLTAGMPILDALQASANVANNSLYTAAILKARTDIATGQQINFALGNTQVLPHMVVQMIAVGEESGTIEEMCSKVASYFEEEVENILSNISSLLEPLIMIILGLVIGTFMVAMYLPIFRLGSVI